jgi:flagellar protein FliS
VQAVGYGAYQKVQAETSSPGELVVLLYDALLKNLRRAVAALEAGESERVNEALTRAQDITLELRAGLDADAELAQELSPLYTFLFRSLVEANVTKDAGLVLKLHEIIAPMRDAWVFAVRGGTPSTGVSGG